MAKNDKLPGHKWFVRDVHDAGTSRFFVYQCRKCDVETLNGTPLPSPYNSKCERPRHTYGKVAVVNYQR